MPVGQLKSFKAGVKRSSPKPVQIEVQNSNNEVVGSVDAKRRPIGTYIEPSKSTEKTSNVSPDVIRRVRNNKEYDNYSPLGVKPGPKPSIGKVVLRLFEVQLLPDDCPTLSDSYRATTVRLVAVEQPSNRRSSS